jgi:hypothetical protein
MGRLAAPFATQPNLRSILVLPNCSESLQRWQERTAESLQALTSINITAGSSHQREERAESIAVGGAGVELEASGKQSASICESSCLPLAFCSLSCSVSLSICLVRCSMEAILLSIKASFLS